MIKKIYSLALSVLLLSANLFGLFTYTTPRARAAMIPTPGQKYDYYFDVSSTTITEKLGATETGHKFSSPQKISGELWKAGKPFNGLPPVVATVGGITDDEGILMYQMQGQAGFYLGVRFKNAETLGLYKKESLQGKDFYLWLHRGTDNKTYEVLPSTMGTSSKELPTLDQSMKDYIFYMNGGVGAENSNVAGIFQKVNNFYTQKIPNGTKICGTAAIDFSKSVYWDKLSENDKKLAPKDKVQWPGDFMDAGATRTLDVPVYIQFKIATDTYVNASMGNISKGYVLISNEGTPSGQWSADLSGLPAGTYKIMPEFFLKNDNPDQPNSVTRPDTPTQGGFKDWSEARQATENNMEIFMNQNYEVTIGADGSISDPAAKNCSLQLVMGPRGFWDAGRLNSTNDGKTECDVSDQSYIVNMIASAFCGLTIILNNWANAFYCWSLGIMEKSLGVTDEATGSASANKTDVCAKASEPQSSPASSEASGTGTDSTSGTPSGGTTDSGTAAGGTGGGGSSYAYVLRAKIQFRNVAKYSALKTAAQTQRGSVWAKIGPLDQAKNWIPNSQHNSSATITFEGWDDLTSTLTATFKAANLVPSIYSSQAILAGTGANNYLLFSEVYNNMVNSGKYENLASN
ncbi:MAG: hypothetical protein WC080_03295 [Patescibacteria group bacterium]